MVYGPRINICDCWVYASQEILNIPISMWYLHLKESGSPVCPTWFCSLLSATEQTDKHSSIHTKTSRISEIPTIKASAAMRLTSSLWPGDVYPQLDPFWQEIRHRPPDVAAPCLASLVTMTHFIPIISPSAARESFLKKRRCGGDGDSLIHIHMKHLLSADEHQSNKWDVVTWLLWIGCVVHQRPGRLSPRLLCHPECAQQGATCYTHASQNVEPPIPKSSVSNLTLDLGIGG